MSVIDWKHMTPLLSLGGEKFRANRIEVYTIPPAQRRKEICLRVAVASGEDVNVADLDHKDALRLYETIGGALGLPDLAALQRRVRELEEALAMIYDRFENGTNCYEDPEDCTGFLGNAVKLTQTEEENIVVLLEGK